MPPKWILCRCEDVTQADVEHAVATGFSALEEVKRYTGFGTGPCQGKECLRAVATAIANLTGQPLADLRPFTSRPPLVPTELKWFAPALERRPFPQGDDDDDARDGDRGDHDPRADGPPPVGDAPDQRR
jgi:bacterioferritin-associated ferredoxin